MRLKVRIYYVVFMMVSFSLGLIEYPGPHQEVDHLIGRY